MQVRSALYFIKAPLTGAFLISDLWGLPIHSILKPCREHHLGIKTHAMRMVFDSLFLQTYTERTIFTISIH